ncbi:MAG: DUF5752 family protein [Deltaproteobacteria bacterium]|jgi:hypothetical protein|nr:DUF5752 family protein [Deltaproteobacteria bacterium]
MNNISNIADKRVNYPFRFFTRVTLPILTGEYALNLRQLLNGIKKADDSIIYYHTHHYLLQHHYMVPSATNDFAYWINNGLGESFLSEEIAGTDIFDYNNIGDYKRKIVEIIDKFLTSRKENKIRQVDINERFNFMKAATFIMDTGKIAYTLREFHDTLANITIFSFYYHFFEAHFRINARMSNDFSMWIKSEIGLSELADKISRLDPYSLTMDNLKTNILKLTESYL